MRDFSNKLARFFAGRYGFDELGKLMLCVCLVLAVVNLFLQSGIVWGVQTALFFLWLVRALSRNIPARVRENDRYLVWRDKAMRWGKLQKNRWRDRKTHVYRICPHCKATIRFSKSRRGHHSCDCPRCHRKFSVHI